jgi:hypothetical protein
VVGESLIAVSQDFFLFGTNSSRVQLKSRCCWPDGSISTIARVWGRTAERWRTSSSSSSSSVRTSLAVQDLF